MLRIGAILLSLWIAYNLVLALGILFMLLLSDTFLGNKDFLANAVSSSLLFCGILFVGIATFHGPEKA